MIDSRDLEQRSQEWHQERCGKVTASRIADVMATTKNGWSAARKKYKDDLIAERLSGKPIIRRVASMEGRSELEPAARVAYEVYTDNVITEVGFIPHPSLLNAGASPDGEVSDDGLVEIKCLDVGTHVDLIKSGIIDNSYLYQMQFQMACTGRVWCDFFAYQPLMPEELKFFRKRIERDDHAIERIENTVKDFLAEIQLEIDQLMMLADPDGRAEIEAEVSDAVF